MIFAEQKMGTFVLKFKQYSIMIDFFFFRNNSPTFLADLGSKQQSKVSLGQDIAAWAFQQPG